MEKKAHGGFALTDRQGKVIIGKGDYENGKFLKQQATSLSFSPAPAILDEMGKKGLLGNCIFAANGPQKDSAGPERII